MAGKIIGELIAKEVYRQKWNIDEFARMICCTRQNVYHLFKRNSIDIVQLQLISKVLNHNFFLDLANNPELAGANDPEVEMELKKRWAVAQFFDALPRVFHTLHIDTNIVVPIMQNEQNDPLPDYGLSDFAIFFTVGERLYDRFNKDNIECFDVQTVIATGGTPVDIWHNKLNHSWFADIMLDFKTEEQWGDTILYLLDNWMPAIKMHIM